VLPTKLTTTPPEPGTVLEVAPGLLWARLPLPWSTIDHVNTYLIEDRGGWAVVDTGLDHPLCHVAWAGILDRALGGARVTRVVVTHFHSDHADGAARLLQRDGAALLMNPAEHAHSTRMHAESPDVAAEIDAFHRRIGLPEAARQATLAAGQKIFRREVALPAAFTPLRPGDVLDIGGRAFRVLTGGGHSVEQVMLHCPEQGVLISADQVLPEIFPILQVYAQRPAEDTLGAFMTSMRALSAEIPEDTLALPGHGIPFRGVLHRLRAQREHQMRRCERVARAFAEGPGTLLEIMARVFPRQPEMVSFGLLGPDLLSLLNHLVAEGTISRHAGEDGVDIYAARPAIG
jgi:glyoxylase-like metal-dependent hydrolase (beta-lactamase superfamily II)